MLDDIIKWKHFPRYWPFVRGILPVTGEFPSQWPVTRSFDVFFDLRLNKRLNKQSSGWWFETLSRPLWRHSNVLRTKDITTAEESTTNRLFILRMYLRHGYCTAVVTVIGIRFTLRVIYCQLIQFRHLWQSWKATLQSRHNERDGICNHQPHDCLLNRSFRRRSKKTSKLRVTGLCVGNSLVTGEFPAQRASNAENVSIWWRHHELWIRWL